MKATLYSMTFYGLLALLACVVNLMSGSLFAAIDIDRIFSTPISGAIILFSLALFAISTFITQLGLYKEFVKESTTFSSRLIINSLIMVGSLPIIFWLDLPIASSYIALLSYTLFFDLFIDNRQVSITWCIWWVIILSAFLSLLIFNSVNKEKSQFTVKSLEKLYTTPSQKFIAQSKLLKSELDRLDFEKLTTIPYPSKIASYDLEEYYKDRIDSIGEYFELGQHHFYCFDSDGESLIEDSNNVLKQIKEKINRSHNISEDILYDPFSSTTIYTFNLLNRELRKDFTFYIESNLNKRKSLNTNYQLYKNGEYHEELKDNFPKDLDNVKSNKYYQINFNDEYTALSYKDVTDIIKPISLFSYLFVLLVACSLLLFFLNTIIPILPQEVNSKFLTQSLQNKFQITVILLIVISFILIGIVTVFFINKMSLRYANNNLERKLALTSQLYETNNVNIHKFQNIVNDLHFSENMHIYLVDAKNQVSVKNFNAPVITQKYSQDNVLLSYELNEKTYFGMHKEVIGADKQSYRISIISTTPSTSLNYINDFIGTLINIYVFLFIIAGAFAIFISKAITDPIVAIGQRLRQLKLGKKNLPIEYSRDDELGALVNEYNLMIKTLDENTKFIAQTEREMAWREMAKQVAHEIKNPLTPMKLSIQYLEKAIKVPDADPHHLVNRISKTLIEQIENLSQIANEFSNFGTLPKGNNEKIVLNEVVEVIHDLFRKRDDMDIHLEEPIDDIIVFADRSHLVRVLNNLVKNAMQAIPEDKRGKINLRLYKEQQNAIIKVSDNGSGIPDEMKEKIFTPNFTTKNSGTGLGLAISLNLLDTFNASLHFETEEGIGSDFYITIPLMRLEEDIEQSIAKRTENRVYL